MITCNLLGVVRNKVQYAECKVEVLTTTGWSTGCSHPTWGKQIIAGKKHKHRFVFTWLSFVTKREPRSPIRGVTQSSPDFPSVSPVPECTVTLPGDGEQGVQSGNTENLSSRSIDDSQGVTGSIFSWRRA